MTEFSVIRKSDQRLQKAINSYIKKLHIGITMKISQITEGKGFGSAEQYKKLDKSVTEDTNFRVGDAVESHDGKVTGTVAGFNTKGGVTKVIFTNDADGKNYATEVKNLKRSDAIVKMGEEKQKGVDGKACWKGYKRMGTKQKNGKTVDNCVPIKKK